MISEIKGAIQQSESSLGATIAKVSFVLFLFFIIFGTSLPFKEKATNADELVASNVINQVVFSLLFIVSSILLLGKSNQLIVLIKKGKFLFLFLAWCTLSIAWSDFNFISLKRLVQIFACVTVSSAVLLYATSGDDLLKYFKWILFLYVLLTVLSILFVPQALDPTFGTWRGLADHKNQLGQICLVSIIIWFYAIESNKLTVSLFPIIMSLTSVVLLFGTFSYTSIIAFFAILLLGILMYITRFLNKQGLGNFFFFVVALSFLGIISSVIFLSSDILTSLPKQFGKDVTFSGRTYLWTDILSEFKRHIIWGCGFGGFWVNENMDLLLLYEQYTWLPRQAHMGYLDIVNETGLVGFSLFLLIVIHYLKNLIYLNEKFWGTGLIMVTLIINFQETTLFRARSLTGCLFILSYLALYKQLFLDRRNVKNPLSTEQ